MTLLLGPVLRHVDDTTALVWVQTERATTVSVLGSEARTFEVKGHHFALVKVVGLAPDSITEYQVALDGEQVWPPATSAFPPSVIRTRVPASAHRLRAVFGSCRYPKTGDRALDAALGLDALDCYAARMATLPVSEWPDALILLGDQVYADELTADARRRLAGRRVSARHGKRPPDEVVSFTEYERLYRASWSDPEIRWVMSTVPTAMIFDDHDVRDDWNTSAAWRAQMTHKSWWPERLRSGLASYWVYQHLGNLSPAELDADGYYQRVLAEQGDCWPLLVELADRADRDENAAKGVRFSFRWDLGRSRLIMADSRNGRMLASGERMMVGDREFDWLAEQACDGVEHLDHLLFGSSLPWLLPYVISDVQSVNELAAQRTGWRGALAERVRQGADLEHWAAFRQSFDKLTDLVAELATMGPATISVLSGDVHHSYAARADLEAVEGPAASVHQLVCSPVHNRVPAFLRQVFRLGWSRRLGWLARRWANHQGSTPLPVRWRNVCGPMFGNTIATLRVDGRSAEVLFEQPSDSVTLNLSGRVPLADT